MKTLNTLIAMTLGQDCKYELPICITWPAVYFHKEKTNFKYHNLIKKKALLECLKKTKENVIKKINFFNVVLLYFKGLQCSRCPSFNQCHGCIVQRMGRITLQPGDHLTVMLNNISTKQLDELMQKYVINHDSMENLRPDTPMSIYDCFRAFMQR